MEPLLQKPAYQMYSALARAEQPTRTLLVFANHAEQRIGGGFVGSVGILNGSKNKLRIESVRSIYYYDHRLEEKGAFVDSPPYLKNIAASVMARDSLIYSDPQTSATLFRDLFARETGEHIDNVVIITPKVLSLLLRYTGPIELTDYNLTITDDNILSVLQQEIEAGEDKREGRDPKTILKVLAEQLLDRVPKLTFDQIASILDDTSGLMQTKQLYAHLSNESVMDKLRPFQAPIAQTGSYNSLRISAANHAANKSSQAIAQAAHVVLRIGEDGTARMSLEITRDHQSDYSGHYIDPKTNEEKYIIGDDLSWLQVELPNGTQDQTDGNMVEAGQNPAIFGMDTLTKPLTKTAIKEEFLLPTRYAMLDEVVVEQNVLAQFGWFGQRLDFDVELPNNYLFAHGSEGVSGSGSTASREFFQIGDEPLRFVFKKQ